MGAPVFAQPAMLHAAGVPPERWDPRLPAPPGETSPRVAGEFSDGAAEIADEFAKPPQAR